MPPSKDLTLTCEVRSENGDWVDALMVGNLGKFENDELMGEVEK